LGECCAPNCSGKACGPDGCGNTGTCGSCSGDLTCDESRGQCVCTAENCPNGCCSNGPGNPGTCQTGDTFQQCGDCNPACGQGQVCQDSVCGVVCGSAFCPAATEICDVDRQRCQRCVVCPSGCLYASVAEAVAEERAGATLYICPGRYEETDSIAISQNQTL